MRPDDLDNSRNFYAGKAKSLKQARRFSEGVCHVVPFCQRDRIFGTMTDENADVVKPGNGVKDVIIEWLILRELFCELVQAWLMAELVGRVRLSANVFGDGVAMIGVWH